MNGPRELPKIDIGGTQFFIDLRLDEFRQVANPFNRIHFDMMFESVDGFLIQFDPKTKNAFEGSEAEFGHRQDLITVELPSLEKMDPVGFRNMVDRWKEDNPIQNALINQLAVVVHNRESPKQTEIKTIGQVVREHKSLLEKRRIKQSKGKKL
jgi:hypothetical protein